VHPTTIAIDLAKSVFEVAVSHHPGRVSQRRRLTRLQLDRFLGTTPPATVLLEACGSAHYWGRHMQSLGHCVKLLPAHDVRPYRRGNKTDQADAKALLEANRNEEICPVPVKTIDQQALTALHRLRSRWLANRTARINTIRGVLREFGLFIPKGAHRVVGQVQLWIRDPESPIPAPLKPVLEKACEEIGDFESRIRFVETQLESLAVQVPAVARLRTLPGIGLLTSTALVGFIGDPHRFRSGRRFASFLGLTPREHSSGLQRRLGSISKRGDVYVRMLLIHGARTVLWHAKRRENPGRLRRWALDLEKHRGHNVAAVALANKLARIAWATWTRDEDFQEQENLN
jgi:transposase